MAWGVLDGNKVAVWLRIRDELVQSSTGPLHRRREAFKILDLFDSPTRCANDFLFLGNPSCCRYFTIVLFHFFKAYISRYFQLAGHDILGVLAMCNVNILRQINGTSCAQAPQGSDSTHFGK